jgi:integrase
VGVIGRQRKGGITWYAVYTSAGRQVHERSGTDRREAERLLARRQREVSQGIHDAPQASGATSLGAWLGRWLDARTNRSAGSERSMAKHLLERPWLASRRLDDLTPRDLVRLVRELQSGGGLAASSIRTTWSVLRGALEDAVVAGALQAVPVMPRRTLPQPSRQGRAAYDLETIRQVLAPGIPIHQRALLATLLYTGTRIDEAAGLTWGDLLDASPLPALSVTKQGDGRPLKTSRSAGDRSRLVPVHPALSEVLEEWRPAWEAIMCRQPEPTDRLLVNPDGLRYDKAWLPPTVRKDLRRLCGELDVAWSDTHSTRHTMITWARRGGARAEVLERITHNASGTMLDRYTHWDWAPLCEAVLAIRYDADHGATPKTAAKWAVCSGTQAEYRAPNLKKHRQTEAKCQGTEGGISRGFRGDAPEYAARHTCGPLGWEIRPQSAKAPRVRRVK